MIYRALTVLSVLCGIVAPAPARPADVVYLKSSDAARAALPFSEAVRVGHMLYLSGQIGTLPNTMTVAPGGIRAEAKQVMDNIKATLERHGYTLNDVVKCTVMLTDMAEWATFNEIYRSYFTGHFPARSALGANGLALGARAEVECIAAK